MKKCDLCWITDANGTKLRRFSLTHSTFIDGRKTSRSAGGIVLCEACWSKVARPRMQAARARDRRAAEIESKRRLVKAGVPLEAVA